jgi:membrane protein
MVAVVLDRAQAVIRRVKHFAGDELWSHAYYRRLPRRERSLVLLARTLYLVWLGFAKERLRLRAAALTYITLLSLIPAVAVGLSIFTAFGGLHDAEDSLRQTIVNNLSVDRREEVAEYLDRFVGSVHAGALGGFGVLTLLFTALSLLSNVEAAFNDIWGVKEDRGFIERFKSFWPLLTLGPVLIGVSLTTTAAISGSAVVRRAIEVIPALGTLTLVTPLVFTWTGFTLLYVIIPNTRVPLRYALIGGVLGGTLWELAKVGYAYYASRAISYSAIYGSLSVVPLFVIWVFVSWMVALIGAQMCFAAQNARTFEPHQDIGRLAELERERLAVLLLIAVYGRFERNEGPLSADELIARVHGPPSSLRRILGELAEAGLVISTSGASEHYGAAYVPGRSAEKTSFADVLGALRGAPFPHEPGDPTAQRAEALLLEAEASTHERLAKVSLRDVLGGVPDVK